MSIVEAGRTRRRRLKPNPPVWSAFDAPLAPLHPDQILSFDEWRRLNRFSVRTGRRVLASGSGPVITQLSPQRFGITVANNAKWQKSRERG